MSTSHTQQPTNVSPSEIHKFSVLADDWWDPKGRQRPLHTLNPLRCAYIEQHALLPRAQVLDVGCGAGLLSEALAKRGAYVTAIDLAPALITRAREHAKENNLEINYQVASVESMSSEGQPGYDIIVCMELLEHVPDPADLIAHCARLLKPGGRLFVSTINRTCKAFALAIVGAEYLTGILPRRTHSFRKFITPSQLAGWMRRADLELDDLQGIRYIPYIESAHLHPNPEVNYIALARKACAKTSNETST